MLDGKVSGSFESARQTDGFGANRFVDAVEGVISAAVHEKNALGLRVRNAIDLAAFAMGNESDEWLTREKKDTIRIEGYEQQFVGGQVRLDELERQIEGLRAIDELLRARFPGPGRIEMAVRQVSA